MNIRYFFSYVFLIILLPGFLKAESTYTVDQTVNIAMKNNSSIIQSNLNVSGLKRKDSKSLNGLTPSLSVGAGVSYPNEPTTYDRSVFLTAEASFSFSAAIAADVRQAKINYEAGLISQEMVLKDIELAVRKSFYGLLYEKINIDLQKRNLETAQSRYEQTLARYKAGRVPEIDVLSAKVSWGNLKPTLASAEITWQNDMACFKQLIGLSQNDDIILDGSLEEVINLGSFSIEGIEIKSNEVRAAEKSLEFAKATATAARFNAYSPVLSFGYSYRPTNASGSVTSETGWNDAGAITAAVTVPLDGLIPWSSSNENIASAVDNVTLLEIQLADTKTKVSVSVESLVRQIAQSQSTIKACQENVKLSERTYSMMAEAYRYGTKDLLSLVDSADSLYKTKASLMSEAYNLISTILELEKQIGVPFGSLGR
ncbi:MAG: TolC family protein [Spirochaetes bacterium]|jgi:outer membrane protein TolC|nr:TolC family protein [Spirochaetota bacterium]